MGLNKAYKLRTLRITKLTLENWLAILTFVIILMWAVSIFLFGRITVKHIENKMESEGILPPRWDKGVGASHIMYAMVIVRKKAAIASPINDTAVLRYAREKDWYLAMFSLISFGLFMILAGVIYFLYPQE